MKGVLLQLITLTAKLQWSFEGSIMHAPSQHTTDWCMHCSCRAPVAQ
jgi:hypothetical protein